MESELVPLLTLAHDFGVQILKGRYFINLLPNIKTLLEMQLVRILGQITRFIITKLQDNLGRKDFEYVIQ